MSEKDDDTGVSRRKLLGGARVLDDSGRVKIVKRFNGDRIIHTKAVAKMAAARPKYAQSTARASEPELTKGPNCCVE